MGGSRPTLSVAFGNAYAVILAGGSGTRFWPLSRANRPKQLLRLLGTRTLLEQTVDRLHRALPPERIYVFTSAAIRREVEKLLPCIPRSHIIAEPAQRNTAPTIGLAAHEILRRDPKGIMVVLPSDQRIVNTTAFLEALAAACAWARQEGRSVIVGIKPTRPETGYGYVRVSRRETQAAGPPIYRVAQFIEKPPLALARRYLRSGHYLWNAGMFVWRASTLLHNLQRVQPRMARGLEQIARAGGVANRAALKKLFPRLPKISIDYALMETLSGVFCVAADLGWSDVGSWAVAYELRKKDRHGNVMPRNSVAVDSRGNLVVSQGKPVVTVGVRDLVIVEADDALLVCARQRSQDVRKAVAELERRGRRELL